MDDQMKLFRRWRDRGEMGRAPFAITRSSGLLASRMTWLVLMPAMTAIGQQVYFDVVPIVACRDVTTSEFGTLNPDERLWEAHLQVSSLVSHGAEKEPEQYLVRIESASDSTSIADFSPKTSVATSVVGNMQIEDLQERNAGAKVSFHADWKGLAQIDAGAQQDDRHTANRRYEMLPPHDLVTASGTTRGGRGVYFKSRPTPQGTLEGARDLQIILRTPGSWRGERLYVYCYAWAHTRPDTDRRPLPSNRAVFSVVLHAAGDSQAKLAAREFLASEESVREVAWKYAKKGAQDNNQWKTVWNQIRGEEHQGLPKNWLQQITTQPGSVVDEDYFARLPSPVQKAVHDHLATAQAFYGLSQRPSTRSRIVFPTDAAPPAAHQAGT